MHLIAQLGRIGGQQVSGVVAILAERVRVLGFVVGASRAIGFARKGPHGASRLNRLIFEVLNDFSVIDALPMRRLVAETVLCGLCKRSRLSSFCKFVGTPLRVIKKLRIVSQIILN